MMTQILQQASLLFEVAAIVYMVGRIYRSQTTQNQSAPVVVPVKVRDR